jgi:hypothetical protein
MQAPILPSDLPVQPLRHAQVTRKTGLMLAVLMPYPRYTGEEPCKDDDAFTHDRSEDGHQDQEEINLMKQVCMACPMRTPCAEWALAHEAHFFWGAMTAAERDEVRASRGQVIFEPNSPHAVSLIQFGDEGAA